MPEISIIVPVYNVEKYIHRCVGSILSQTFSDFELILVDDGSSDNCGAICDEYAKKDSRVIVLHKNNGGQAAARNSGIDIATGQWILFCDSDDCYHGNYLSEFLACADLSEQTILYAFDFLNVWPDGVEYAVRYPESNSLFASQADNISFIASSKSHTAAGYALWNKLYSKEIIDRFHIRMLERDAMGNRDDWAEDLTFNLQYFMSMKTLQVSESPVYLLTKHGTPAEQHENGLIDRIDHMLKIFSRIADTPVYRQSPDIEKSYWMIAIWHLRRYFYLEAGANGVACLREKCRSSCHAQQLNGWIDDALLNWDSIHMRWSDSDARDYLYLLKYIQNGNMPLYKARSYWLWKIQPVVHRLLGK